ncbi:restriction endonuclease subunit S [Microcoleus sp. BR0-C5]|uniref:restriction endonuclease subunit S n=1 Tax=Microcoleus sp. BR0-C5 TaxID=2818713 RepID=UPI002FD044DF
MRHKFPPSWPTRSFKEVAEVITGTTPLTSHPEYYGGSIPFIGPAELGGVESITQSPKSLSDDGVKQARLLPAEAVLVCCIGATIGKVGFSGTELATNQQINALVCDKDIVFPRYVFHYCRTLESLIRHQGASTTLPLLPKGRFQDIEIPIPTLEEQHRIAEVLDRAEELRSKRREAIAQLDTLIQAIFLEMFGDPVSNPKGWEVRNMDECAERIQIGPFGTQLHEEDYIDNGIPLINPTHIQDGKIFPNTSFSISYEKHQQLSQYHLEADDVILGRRGEMGRCAIVSQNEHGWLCGTGSLFIRQKNALIHPIYLFSILSNQSIKKYLEKVSQGVTMANLNKTIVSQIPVTLPPLELQKEFAHRVKAVEKLKAAHRASLSELDALFASLQHRAFRGEL